VRVTSVTGFSMDSLITAAARALAAGDPLAALKRVALRDDPPALALRGIRWRGSAILIERRLFSRAGRIRITRSRLDGEGARRRAADARRPRRSCKCRACAASRGPASSPDRTSRRGRACARWARSGAVPARLDRRLRTGRCGDRNATRSGQGGARCARSDRACRGVMQVSLH
jgi:hypothetical protein